MSDRDAVREAALDLSRAIADRELARRADELLTPGFVYHGPAGMELDRSAYVEFMEGLGAAFPDMQMTFEPVVVDGDRVGVHWANGFTHQGPYMGVPPTGKAMRITGTYIREIRDGRVAEEWDTTDIFGLAQQLGMIPG